MSTPFGGRFGEGIAGSDGVKAKSRTEGYKSVKVEDDSITEQRPHVPGPGRGDER